MRSNRNQFCVVCKSWLNKKNEKLYLDGYRLSNLKVCQAFWIIIGLQEYTIINSHSTQDGRHDIYEEE